MNEGTYSGERPGTLIRDAQVAQLADNRPQAATNQEYALPPPMERPIARPISIQSVNHGFVVTVGCQTFAVESVDTLLHRISVYLKYPVETEKKWLNGQWEW